MLLGSRNGAQAIGKCKLHHACTLPLGTSIHQQERSFRACFACNRCQMQSFTSRCGERPRKANVRSDLYVDRWSVSQESDFRCSCLSLKECAESTQYRNPFKQAPGPMLRKKKSAPLPFPKSSGSSPKTINVAFEALGRRATAAVSGTGMRLWTCRPSQ